MLLSPIGGYQDAIAEINVYYLSPIAQFTFKMALEDTLDPFDVITVVVPGSIVVITLVAILAPERLADLFTNVGNILLVVFLSYISGQTIVLINGVFAGQWRIISGSSVGFLFHSTYEPTPVFIQQFKIGMIIWKILG